MQLTKPQIEAVRYQLKKLETTATNDEIRNAANQFIEFDPLVMANLVIKTRESSLTSKDNQTDIGGKLISNTSGNHQSSTGLTQSQKQTLTTIQAQQLGIELNQNEIIQITSMVDSSIVDSIDYLNQVSGFIQAFIQSRNAKTQAILNEKIQDISTIINTGNDQLAEIFDGANKHLLSIVDNCKQQATDYKSPYTSRLQNIKETLGLS